MRNVRATAMGLAVAGLLLLAGCKGFFVPVSTTGGGGTTVSGDYVYVANSTTDTVTGYSIASSSGALTAVTNSPYALSLPPLSLAITPNNKFLYVGGTGFLNVYVINSDGSLTLGNGGQVVASTLTESMDVSPDGQWLFVLNNDAQTLSQFQINATNGSLTAATGATFSVGGTSSAVKVAPTGNYVFVALGTGGDLVFPFNTTTGVLGTTAQQLRPPVNTSDNALAVDATTSYLYIARSGAVGSGLAVYTVANGGVLSSVTGSPYATGVGPHSVTLDGTGTYAYVGNRTDGTIGGYSIAAGGTLTALASAPYPTGTLPVAIGRDNTGKYLAVASNGGSPDLQIFGFDGATPGKLISVAKTATGTDPTNPVAIALTH